MMNRLVHRGGLVFLAGAIAGCSYTPPPDGLLTVTDQSYDFGKVLVGDSTTTSGRPDWKNTGRGVVRINGLTMAGDTGAIEQIAPFFPLFVNPGNLTWSIFFSFKPGEARRYTVQASPFGVGPNNRPVAADSTELTGTGVFQVAGGDLSLGGGYVQPGKALDFGNVVVKTSAYRTLTIANSGAGDIAATAHWAQQNQPFTVSMSSGGPPVRDVTVPAGGSVTVIMTFTPPAAQEYVNALVFRSVGNDLAGITVVGKGVAPIG
jgi:hypothetical protein